MLTRKDTIEETRAAFRWKIPERYNIGVDVCDRIADERPDALAIRDVRADGVTEYSFAELQALSNRLANGLSARVSHGDRVGVLLPQRVETAVSHIAVFKCGAISIPLFVQFGEEALGHRLRDSGARVVITDAEGAAKLARMRGDLPDLAYVISVEAGGDLAWDAVLDASEAFTPIDTGADDPALLIYTSGTTGPPKGALHAHRVLLGHLPGVEMSHDFLPQPGDCIWTPADWAWIGGLLDVLLPALHHGVPVVAHRFERFTGEAAFAFMAEHGVRNAFLPPTALRLMAEVADPPRVSLRSVASGGETLGAGLIGWGQEVLGVTINEFYGQTECNMIVSNCAALADPVPGEMGFAVPGHEVAVIDPQTGREVAVGVEGEVAVKTPSPVQFLGYWNQPEASAAKVAGGWLRTGDRAHRTAEGRFQFVGRDDDVISSAGYRIGPGEIEDCLCRHPCVQRAAVVAAPDAVRGSVVAAFVVPAEGAEIEQTALAEHVRTRLAAYEVPKRIIIVDSLPMTTTGKIIRSALRERLAD